MLRKEPCPGPYKWPDVVPLTMRGDTLVTMSLSRAKVFVRAKPHPAYNAIVIDDMYMYIWNQHVKSET